MKKMFFLIGIIALSGCVSVNSEEVKEMPTGYLCSLLNPDSYMTTGSERRVIFKELKDRDEDCMLPQGASR
jgi:hypothetical protein